MVVEVIRTKHGSYAVRWPGGYRYDFWHDVQAATRAAEEAERLLLGGASRNHVDRVLRARGLLSAARTRESVAPPEVPPPPA